MDDVEGSAGDGAGAKCTCCGCVVSSEVGLLTGDFVGGKDDWVIGNVGEDADVF